MVTPTSVFLSPRAPRQTQIPKPFRHNPNNQPVKPLYKADRWDCARKAREFGVASVSRGEKKTKDGWVGTHTTTRTDETVRPPLPGRPTPHQAQNTASRKPAPSPINPRPQINKNFGPETLISQKGLVAGNPP